MSNSNSNNKDNNDKEIIAKIKENISERMEENPLFSYDVNFDDQILTITFKGTAKDREDYSEYIQNKIHQKVRNKKERIETEENGIYTIKYILRYPRLEDMEILLRIRAIKDKSLEENILDWSEGSKELYELMMLFKDYGIETHASCGGHGKTGDQYLLFYVSPENEEMIRKVFKKFLEGKYFGWGVDYYNGRKRAFVYPESFSVLTDLFKKAKNNTLEIDENSINYKLTEFMFNTLDGFSKKFKLVSFNRFSDEVAFVYKHLKEDGVPKEDLEKIEKAKKAAESIREREDDEYVETVLVWKQTDHENIYNAFKSAFK